METDGGRWPAAGARVVRRVADGVTRAARAAREPLGQSEEAVSRVASALAEDVALLERGGDRAGPARPIRTLDSLTQVADQQMLAAGQLARRDFLDRQQALQLAAGEVLRDAIL